MTANATDLARDIEHIENSINDQWLAGDGVPQEAGALFKVPLGGLAVLPISLSGFGWYGALLNVSGIHAEYLVVSKARAQASIARYTDAT